MPVTAPLTSYGWHNNLFKRQLALFVSVFVGLAAGTPYLYGVYGPQLVKQCGLTTTDSATISLCTNIGAGFGGLPGGVIIDKFGPRAAIIIGSFFITVGYYGVFQIYQDGLSLLLLICVFMCLMGFGSITSYFASLKAAQANFPKHRGSAGAIPVSCYGLSATVMSFIAATFYNGNSGAFIGFLSIFCGSITFVGSWFVNIYINLDDEDGDLESSRAGVGSSTGGGILGASVGANTAKELGNSSSAISDLNDEDVLLLSRENSSSTLNDLQQLETAVSDSITSTASSMGPPPAPAPTSMSRTNSLHGSFSFWGIGTRTPRSSVSSLASSSVPLVQSFRDQYQQSSRTPISNQPSLNNLNGGAVLQHRKPKTSLQVVTKLLTDKIFLLHFLLVSVLSGTGQMYIYSVGFIVVAQYHYENSPDSSHTLVKRLLETIRGAPPSSDGMAAALQALQVSIISISSFAGRLVAGLLSDYIHKKYHIQRLWIVLITIIFLAMGQFLLMYIQDSHLIAIPSIIIGGSYGLIFGTYPAVIADGFGTKTFSTTWGLICTGPLITLFILNKYFGVIYDANTDPTTGICYKGNGCYRGAFELSFGLCLMMFAVTLFVLYIQRKTSH